MYLIFCVPSPPSTLYTWVHDRMGDTVVVCSGSHMRSHAKYKAHIILCSVYTCTCMHTNVSTHHSSPTLLSWSLVVWSVVYACTCTRQNVHMYIHPCTHTRIERAKAIFLSYLSVFLHSDNITCRTLTLPIPLPSRVHNKDVIVLEPHPHHTLLASFGEDTAENEEEMDNTHMWCEV